MKYFLLLLLTTFASSFIWAAPDKELDPYWQDHVPTAIQSVSHASWQILLDQYLITDASGQTFFHYGQVTEKDKKALKSYLENLTALDPLQLTRAQQQAYWINLYNGATVDLILDHYPLKSITKLGKGFLSFGPWNDKILSVNERSLSLNDIEHRILRPIYNDPRIHYAVNCASYSCPNLAAQAYTQHNVETLLEQGAADYINHPRGATFKGEKLELSSIYKWYRKDFGEDKQALLQHLQHYAQPELKAALQDYQGKISYEYNWDLNEAP